MLHRVVAAALDHDRLTPHRHGRDVEGRARGRLEGADAALAQHDALVPLLRDVLGRQQPLLDGVGQAALEEDGLVGAADLLHQVEVLHVARAHLDDVGHLEDALELADVHELGDDGQAGLLAGRGQDLQCGLAEPLEGVRRGARLVGATAQHAGTRGLHHMGGAEGLLAGLHGPHVARQQQLQVKASNNSSIIIVLAPR